MKTKESAMLPGGTWSHGHFNAQCWSRNVDRAVIDFIRHNMGDGAALAALQAMPVAPTTDSKP
jgi:hypothetical protein